MIVDHGMGVQSLYAHLSSIDVKVGDAVAKGQTLGRSGMTGLAGGDHLHFTMLVGGQPVTPVDWWSKQWIEDRILRKIREAGRARRRSEGYNFRLERGMKAKQLRLPLSAAEAAISSR